MSELIHLDALRKAKDAELALELKMALETFSHWQERHANIREKVKAKTLFRSLIAKSDQSSLTERESAIFNDWFSFDYQTAAGKTMYQLYLTGKNSASPADALLLANLLKPYLVTEKHFPETKLQPLLIEQDKKSDYLSLRLKEEHHMVPGSFLFLRCVPLLGSWMQIGTAAYASSESVSRLTRDFYNCEELGETTFLKRYALQYVEIGKAVEE
ncbi:hypothetical protein GJU40_11225 [Bacillus lacus]|uniref:Uncharacterized protein n=1 Tax=Metabacillus lacus TaxID=1983721 RepID=A0A7X2IZL1_9BACI|nr:hypothetical protein [Metabacillus lacus]MRX72720.1 hypothetical protein [Metabacillus lacus]